MLDFWIIAVFVCKLETRIYISYAVKFGHFLAGGDDWAEGTDGAVIARCWYFGNQSFHFWRQFKQKKRSRRRKDLEPWSSIVEPAMNLIEMQNICVFLQFDFYKKR